ncbi:sterol desaturase family protein [Pseudidiomarina terrestris]|uniref:Sterol desaturase family protein n=1 Tax=Pseudidiomarina terrestris TaxID=2820060 RepID=A0AAW7QVK9_9GAMM|nr:MULTISPECIES: sterol desaturase family protein [unclassified Pseudidiomarina]MDN7124241.1 sterol desaturase family protein [Pseudidiomarina sp. 1APP75-32.1]MDN7127308.1 sterol desaturase family protein [Pseudidiomarina sp. 1APR75-33.1]MDN7135254.1 sterol desaturase family protein [Pseudidiomarina sp. 1ASP75-5]MDN7138687.1 sterol desaturase family protein [Pseudidiomarina sp. 1ASP75-14]
MPAEVWWRLGCFVGVLAIMLLWERLNPKRKSRLPAKRRWPANLGIVAINTVLLRLLIPAGAIGAALWAEQTGFGLLPGLDWPLALNLVLGFLILDCTIYWQHRMFHRIPLLWRIHRMHHADADFDATTGLRFHPLEILLSMLIKIGVVVVFGIPALAVLIFEIVLNATSLFNHGNVALPSRIEWPVRRLIVTQEMHRIHHSQLPHETNSNYSFNLSVWDRLFRSYTARPEAGSDGINIGLKEYPAVRESTKLSYLLAIPFRQPKQADAGSDSQDKDASKQ